MQTLQIPNDDYNRKLWHQNLTTQQRNHIRGSPALSRKNGLDSTGPEKPLLIRRYRIVLPFFIIFFLLRKP